MASEKPISHSKFLNLRSVYLGLLFDLIDCYLFSVRIGRDVVRKIELSYERVMRLRRVFIFRGNNGF